jgi:hypothetical protein
MSHKMEIFPPAQAAQSWDLFFGRVYGVVELRWERKIGSCSRPQGFFRQRRIDGGAIKHYHRVLWRGEKRKLYGFVGDIERAYHQIWLYGLIPATRYVIGVPERIFYGFAHGTFFEAGVEVVGRGWDV